MALYFIKDTTLTNIADAIREKTGDSASIPVANFAAKIASIVAGGGESSGGSTGGGDITLPDFEFNQGSFSTASSVTQKTIAHGLSKMPDLIIVHPTISQNVGEDLDATWDGQPLLFAWGVKSTVDAPVKGGILQVGWGLTLEYGIDEMTTTWKNTGAITCSDETTFTVGKHASLSGTPNQFIPNASYNWYAFAGLIAAGVKADYTVTFMSEDGSTQLYKKSIMEHDTCVNPVTWGLINRPTKASTAQYNYSFSGWATTANGEASSSALTHVTSDRTVYAAFASEVRYYTINFYDGDSLLTSMICAYGTTPEYTPSKAGYLFNGWDTAIVPVTGDANYYAQFIKDAKSNGTCGDNLTWVLGNDGVLTISGTGDMYDYESTTMPWYDYNADITSVVIEEGVTSIGFYAFYGCGMSSISIPDGCILHTEKNTDGVSGVNNYKGHQFGNCTKLESLIIPEGNTVISLSLCNGCSALESVTIPSTMVYIGEAAFMDTKLTAVTIPSKVTHINGRAFAISTLTSAIFEDTTTWAYWNYNSSYTSFVKKGALASADLANSATAATYLNNTYKWDYWRKT